MIVRMRNDDRTMDLSAEEGARIVALGLVAEAKEAAKGLASGAGKEPLHDFRVALRRLRTALRTFRPWLEEGVRPRHEKRLKRIARSTNEARDAEVQLAWLATKRDALASAHRRAGYDDLVARFETRARSGPDAVRVAERFLRAAEKLARRLGTYERTVDPGGGDAGASFGGVLASLVGDQVDALSEAMVAIRAPSDQEGVHWARIEGKRLRYLLEPLRGYRGADAGDVVGHLKRLQDVLGELHDAHVLAGELRDALTEAAAERARQLHQAVYEHGASDVALRDRLRASPRPGLLALVRLVRERRDALYADLEREWRGGGMGALAAEVRTIAEALEARAGGKLEHERKFLLAALPPRAAEEGVEIVQGWLPGARLRERIRRVRGAEGDRYWRGLKLGSGGARLEAEEETTREVFDALWPLTEGRRVSKRRRKVQDGALVWELDEFMDRELVIAEVELPARATDAPIPDWLRPLVMSDVTEDPAYTNEALAANPGAPPLPGAPTKALAPTPVEPPTAPAPPAHG